MSTTLPIAVIGAGPVGLSAAARLVERDEPFVTLEAGSSVGTSVRDWGHVQLFSPWRYVVDPAARALLESTGWEAPDPDTFPSGDDLVDDYLAPLADHPAIAPGLRLRTRVTKVTRTGADKLVSAGRAALPFELLVDGPDGPTRIRARAVIDASGTWTRPNPLGSDGLPVDGEVEAGDRVVHRIPDARGRDRDRYAGRTTAIVGSGHSAFNAVLELAALAEEVAGTEVIWAIRRQQTDDLFGGGADDALPRRGALGLTVRRLVDDGRVRLETDLRTTSVRREGEQVLLEGIDHLGVAREVGPVDEVVALTGFRPDLGLISELRVDLDPVVEAPAILAPLIDPNLHSCGTVPPHGATELAHPEPGYFTVGMKSYGRAPTFLLLTGYEQVRSVVAALVGDHEAAVNVELALPPTGVCSGPGLSGDLVSVAGAEVRDEAAGVGVGEERSLPQASGGGCCG